MIFYHDDFRVELHDAWWLEAGMEGFVPYAAAYRVDPKTVPVTESYDFASGTI